ncbi:hypothetical protein G3I59_42210 [Amycolatopsis rubida]|uniref:Uncharacterized protein n=1 Tax=Amycolatopsis rubida TaxID=112413 RepID=A0ABX0C303_9PSEU|nr:MULTISPECIES: hypothetical protein [Amycolatopsis]MYW97056.1 hypothetical protein [Amycolatopsis rubida]NEC62041.1 hypothetical protein [Amycolatopsis rubida]
MNATLSRPGAAPAESDGAVVLDRSAGAVRDLASLVVLGGRAVVLDRSAVAHALTSLVVLGGRAVAPDRSAATNSLTSLVVLGGRAVVPDRSVVAHALTSLVVLGGRATAPDRSAATNNLTSSAASDLTPAHPNPPHQPTRSFAPTPSRAYAAPTLTGGTPRTQRNRVVALAGYPQQICGQLDGLWITQGHRGDNPVADRMTQAGAGRGEWA